jgi:hypothetical protein
MQIALRLSQVLVNHFWLLWLSGLAGILAVSIGLQRTGEKARLYLRADTGLVMNSVSYLSYRGLPFHRASERQGLEAIDVAGTAPFPNGLCVDFADFACRHDVMRPGDLLAHLPEEPWQQAGTSVQPLFEASPAELFPLLRPFLAALYRLSPTMYGVYRDGPLRDDWLGVSVGKVLSSP